MMNQMNLNAFNPLNVIHQGGNKVQHPTAGYSNTISQNVEGMHKEFSVFHKNLKNLVMLYKTRHQLMESLNENGLYTAKCYNEMLGGSPLSPIVVPDGKPETAVEMEVSGVAVSPPPSAPPPAAFDNSISFEESEFVASNKKSQPKSLEEKLATIGNKEDIEPTEYPDSGVIREKLDPDEGSRIAYDLSRNSTREPEGLKASKKMSMNAANASYVASEIKEVVETNGRAKDPPSANSIGSGGDSITEADYEQKRCSDPPPTDGGFPDDETEVTVEKNPHHENSHIGDVNISDEMGGSVNFIVDDDDDSFTDGRVSKKQEVLMIESEKTEVEEKTEDVGEEKEKEQSVVATGVVLGRSGEDIVNDFKEKLLMKDDFGGDEQEFAPFPDTADDELHEERDGEEKQDYAPFPDIAVDEPELRVDNGNSESSTDSDDDNGGKDGDYLNISADGELVVMKGSPAPVPKSHPAPSPKTTLPYHSYFDVHKAAYKETNEKLDDHSNLVAYVETWEQIVSKRVQSKYDDYAKYRTNLNHYTKKVSSLLAEEEKLKEKGKHMKPKQIEKLERNQDKLTGARETHDSSGESLLMLMDEVILRSYRDAFPLLKRSMNFERDFAAINQTHMENLAGSLDLLETIGKKESLTMEGRLESFQNMSPEDIYTGSKDYQRINE